MRTEYETTYDYIGYKRIFKMTTVETINTDALIIQTAL